MTYILNDPACESLAGNTGIPSCALDPKKIVGVILIPKALVFDSADIGDIITVLQTASTAAASIRAYPIFRFEEVADNSGDVSVQAYGYGSEKIVRDGKYNWTFKIINGGVMLQANIRKFNKSTAFKVLLIMDDGLIIGTKSGTTSMTGITLDYSYGYPWKISDGAGTFPSYQFRLALAKPEEINEDIAFIDTEGSDIEALVTGILDVELYELEVAAGYWTIGVRTVADKVSLYDAYDDELNDLACWSITKAGAAVTPTAIAKDAVLEGWKLSLTTPTGAHVASLTSAATLAANDVGGTPETGFETASGGTLSHTWV